MLKYTIAIFLILFTVSCTKVLTYGATNNTKPLAHSYSSNLETAMHQTTKALESLGYEVLRKDEYRHRITTNWVPTKSDSHYLDLFKRRDYGASAGSYYQVVADIKTDGTRIKVSVSTVIKSISGKLKSSKVVEKKVLTKIDDFMRSPQIVITNVGMSER